MQGRILPILLLALVLCLPASAWAQGNGNGNANGQGNSNASGQGNSNDQGSGNGNSNGQGNGNNGAVGSRSNGNGGPPSTLPGKSGQGPVLSQDDVLAAVEAGSVVSFESLLPDVRARTGGDVIEAKLQRTQGFLIYAVTVLTPAGKVSTEYYYARSGIHVERR